MAAGSAGSAGSAGNAYVVDTDSPFQTEYGFSDTMKTIKKAFVGPEKAELLEQIQELLKKVQGLQTQKQNLLQTVRQLTNGIEHMDGNVEYTQDYRKLYTQLQQTQDEYKKVHGRNLSLEVHAENEHKKNVKVHLACTSAIQTLKDLFEDTRPLLTSVAQNQLVTKIAQIESLAGA